MFAKPYKLKSNTSLKNSEKKHLAQRIQDEFPSCTEEKVKELVPVKASCISMKLVLHSEEVVSVYAVDGVPMIIETEGRLLPTVCALWKVPDLVPVLAIHSPVLPKIQGGAPLYLPGVVTPAGGAGFPMFQRNAVIAMCTQDNAAAGVVGRALMSSADMLLRAAGVCLETYHVIGDQLCKDNKFSKIERPKMGPASYSQGDVTESITADVSQLSIQPTIKEEWPSLGKRPAPPAAVSAPTPPAVTPTHTPAPNEPKIIEEQPLEEVIEPAEDSMVIEESSLSEELSIPSEPDALLRWCLLSFLKLQAKNHEYPFKTNLLYKSLMQMCPPDRTVDVKKSSYKKVGKFLEAMQQEGLLEVREIEKGVAAVTAVNLAHPAVRTHGVSPALRELVSAATAPPAPPGPEDGYVPPQVREMFCVTAAVQDLFAPVKKGTALSPAEVRTRLTEYVKTRNLNSTEVKGAVVLDATLAKITGRPEGEAMKWDTLMLGTQGRMTPSTEMRFEDGSVKLSKTKLEPIRMQVAQRSGNKKVTLVSNLEAFGFSLPALSHVCQTGVAASCGVTRSPGSKCDQLMIQGDQTYFVAKLLIEKYGLPKKYVEGADKALKKKK
ncbi:eukaryotic translation initiation factor 2D [Anticarsia gemmatalis]|uniref:eukaryotic translation initiation factor 2D n=1 Tax=Anticarsia gemmatalis TaxID=129554 RepID=UPI003F7718DD